APAVPSPRAFSPTRRSSDLLKGVIAQTLCKKLGGGRVAAREILLTTPAVSNLIREGKTFQIPSIIQTSKQLGMLTLNDALIELRSEEHTSELHSRADPVCRL